MFNNELGNYEVTEPEMLLNFQSYPKEIINIRTDEEFNSIVRQYPEKVFAIDCWAEWCGPCKLFTPIFKKLQEEFRKDFIFIRVNVGENQQFALKNRVTSIPALIFMKGGKAINKIVGLVNHESLRKVLIRLKN